MKRTTIFLFFWLCLQTLLPAQAQLLRIEEAGKYGYINMNGEILITPKYASAFEFSEGLAAVRLTDKFGFIDSTGNWKISPIYDYAKPFKNGQASVWLGSKELLISPNGITSSLPKKSWNEAAEGCSILKSSDGKIGVTNQQGDIILDTIYYQVKWRKDGYYNISKKKIIDGEHLVESGIADRLGKIIIPVGKYTSITAIESGWFLVSPKDNSLGEKPRDPNRKKAYGILKLEDCVFRPITDPRFEYIEGKISDGCIRAIFSDADQNNLRYRGFIDTTGQVILADTNYSYAYPFLNGYAFVSKRQDKSRVKKKFLINKKGEILNKINITGIQFKPYVKSGNHNVAVKDYFINEWVIVTTENGIGRINRKGEVQIIKELAGMYSSSLVDQRYLHVLPNRDQPKPHYRGVYDVISGKLLPIRYKMIYQTLYGNKLFFVIDHDQRGAYVDTSGNIIWQQKKTLDRYPYDVSSMFGLTVENQKTHKLGWFYRFWFRKPKISFSFLNFAFTENGRKYKGHNLYLMNPSRDTMVFDAQLSGRLPFKLQAKDANGEWQTINYCKGCDVVFLNGKKYLLPGDFWGYRIPQFKGHVKTEFRIVVSYTKKGEPDVPLEMIKTFQGGINPAQFWRTDFF